MCPAVAAVPPRRADHPQPPWCRTDTCGPAASPARPWPDPAAAWAGRARHNKGKGPRQARWHGGMKRWACASRDGGMTHREAAVPRIAVTGGPPRACLAAQGRGRGKCTLAGLVEGKGAD